MVNLYISCSHNSGNCNDEPLYVCSEVSSYLLRVHYVRYYNYIDTLDLIVFEIII